MNKMRLSGNRYSECKKRDAIPVCGILNFSVSKSSRVPNAYNLHSGLLIGDEIVTWQQGTDADFFRTFVLQKENEKKKRQKKKHVVRLTQTVRSLP